MGDLTVGTTDVAVTAERRTLQSAAEERAGDMRSRRRTSSIIEILGRIGVVAGAVAVGMLAAGTGSALWFVGIAACWALCVQFQFMNRGAELAPLGPTVPATRGVLLGVVTASAVTYWFGSHGLNWRELVVTVLVMWAGLMAWQAVHARFVAVNKRIVLVGDTPLAHEIIRELKLDPTAPFDVVGIVEESTGAAHVSDATPRLGVVEELPIVIEEERRDLIVPALDRNRPAVFGHLLESASAGFRV